MAGDNLLISYIHYIHFNDNPQKFLARFLASAKITDCMKL